MTHQYDQVFMDYTSAGSRHAAARVVALLQGGLDIGSVLDVGCANGAWLAAWRQAGVGDVFGVDGDYVDRSRLAIPIENFQSADLAQALSLGRRFDLVQSLEVAEHIDARHADRFVANLVGHSRGLILFSAAPPGQGGEHHVNEQPYDYWRERFARHGYRAFDAIRPDIAGDAKVPVWYRYNTMLYVADERIGSLSEPLARAAVPHDTAIPDISPGWYRARKWLVRLLPQSVQLWLANLKSRRAAHGR